MSDRKTAAAHISVGAEVVGDAVERSFTHSCERVCQQRQVVQQRESQRLNEVQQTNGNAGYTEVDQQQWEPNPVNCNVPVRRVARHSAEYSACKGQDETKLERMD